ncbi:DUF3157 family protein [Mariniflexile gromovii]|uniref:DUF3157 family protein n=1 Tax=Mariniflexile gromovii TaxID=362523 RepID=A0ABS4BYU8_9FLAO|nr:DUF3157 family protein [Mariniflexile gromovii]MBP0905764.1 DUF3157 family protein [Mariniflexile gromovii]
MKKCLFLLLFFISCIGFSQNNHIVKTEDGRRVWLKADFTWEYIDAEIPKENVTKAPIKKDKCKLADGFIEPELDNKIQSQLKKGRATIDHVKAKVAKDYNCKVEDVILLSFTEQKVKAVYHFCANGTKVTYKRNGHAIIESGKFF